MTASRCAPGPWPSPVSRRRRVEGQANGGASGVGVAEPTRPFRRRRRRARGASGLRLTVPFDSAAGLGQFPGSGWTGKGFWLYRAEGYLLFSPCPVKLPGHIYMYVFSFFQNTLICIVLKEKRCRCVDSFTVNNNITCHKMMRFVAMLKQLWH